MNAMRFNIIDPAGTVSFVAPCHTLKVITAACARNPATLSTLLDYSEPYDPQLKPFVLNGLAVFDERNSDENTAAFRSLVETTAPEELPPFRVIDSSTREASLVPIKAGLVLFNLPARRIIQVQNTYADVEREARGRIRENGAPTGKFYRYKLPDEWRLVP